MDALLGVLLVTSSAEACHDDVDTGTHTDEEAGVEHDHSGGRPHRSQGQGPREPPHHRDVGHGEQDLENIGEHEREAEKQNIFTEGALGHLYGLRSHTHSLKKQSLQKYLTELTNISLYKKMPFFSSPFAKKLPMKVTNPEAPNLLFFVPFFSIPLKNSEKHGMI